MRLIGIVACTPADGIGLQDKIPWRLPADQKQFKRFTLHQPVIMGRVTYEGLPSSVKPLPDRFNIVVTRDPHAGEIPDAELLPLFYRSSLEGALELAKAFLPDCRTREVFVIGGATIFHALWEKLDALYLTRVHVDAVCDCAIPPIDPAKFLLRYEVEHPATLTAPAWTFNMYERAFPKRP